MRTYIEHIGRTYAREVLAECQTNHETTAYPVTNVCEGCGKAAGEVLYSSTEAECRACFVDSMRYWEYRGGHSSEHIFGKEWGRTPAENSRVWRTVMGAYFAELAGQ
jgi:hypothetical protein